MTTGPVTAGWFGPPGRQLFGVLHARADGRARGGVILCPPFLTERYWAHEAYRELSAALAGEGFAVLRFDYRGTADSSGGPEDLGDLAVWSDDIRTAVAELERRGVRSVAAVGLRCSATLLASEAAERFACRVLWDPVPSGRAYLRQTMLLHRSVVAPEGACPPPDDRATDVGDDGAALTGYPFPPSFVRSIRDLRVGRLDARSPVLVLTRSGQVPAGWTAEGSTEVGTADAQAGMLDVQLDRSAVPRATLARVASWLSARMAAEARPMASEAFGELSIGSGDGYERVEWWPQHGEGGDRLFAIRTVPGGGPPVATCVMPNSGLQFHIGPHRLYVDLARRLAEAGVASLRLDLRGIGESGGTRRAVRPPHFDPRNLTDLDGVVDGIDGDVICLGVSSGGYHCLEAAARKPLLGSILVHPGLEFANTSTSTGVAAAERVVAPVADRPWLRAARRRRIGEMANWHTPVAVWWLLDRTRVQPDVSRAFEAARRRTPRLALVAESELLRSPRFRLLTRRIDHTVQVVLSEGDHSLYGERERRQVADACVRIVAGWLPERSPTRRAGR